MYWRALFLLWILAPSNSFAANPIHADGNVCENEAITCDLPTSEHLKNSAGRDGLGLCVFTSIDHAARWCNEPALIGFRDFMTTQLGGGWPEKVAEFIPKMAASKSLSVPNYVQHTGGDAEFLRMALKTGRYVCVTYSGRDNVFYRGPIAHMVNLVHFSDKWAVLHDNNYPGKWLWMPPAEFLNRWRGSGGGWAIVLLKPGPPPIPVNVQRPVSVAEVARLRDSGPSRSLATSATGEFLPDDRFVDQCPPGGCPIPNLEWRPDAEYAGWFYLYRGAKQLGTWHPDGRGYLALQPDGTFGKPSEPPIALPLGAIPNFGLDPKRVSSAARYHLNGKEVSRGEAIAAFNGLADDSAKFRLTIVGDADLRRRVLSDLSSHPGLLAWRDRLLVQDYPPDHWAVSGVGFAPGITLQPPPDADGKAPVLFRLTAYAGPDALVGAIRKADPNYRPDRDPEPGKTNPSTPMDASKLPLPMWVLGGLGVVLFLFRRKEKS